MPSCTREQFVEIWNKLGSPKLVADELGISTRKVQERRRKIEGAFGIQLECHGSLNPAYQIRDGKHVQVSRIENGPQKHCVIPDVQAKPGVPLDHLEWAGRYIAEKRPDTIICIGDFADMASLSSYDRGKRSFEGRRYRHDIDAAKRAMDLLMAPILKEAGYNPRLVLTLGNHEHRIVRATDTEPILDGTIGLEDLAYDQWGWDVKPFLEVVKIDGVAYCLDSDHKILTKDLRYIRLGDVKEGQEIFAFDEQPLQKGIGRRYKTGIVQKVDKAIAKLFEVKLSSGKVFRVTADHLWLARKYGTSQWGWVRTDELKLGISEACQIFPEWEMARSYESGWLSGIIDGEGHLSKPNTKQGGIQIGVAQRFGVVLDKILECLKMFDIPHRISGIGGTHNDVANVRILGPSGVKMKLLGVVRPERLINKMRPEMLGRVQKMDGAPLSIVESITLVGDGEITMIKTSTNTMIVDGYAHHNCHYFYNHNTGKPYAGSNLETRLKTIGMSFTMGHQQGLLTAIRDLADGTRQRGLVCGSFYQHEEEYRGPQANSHWQGIIMKHEVMDGNYDLLEVSMNYLRRKYS